MWSFNELYMCTGCCRHLYSELDEMEKAIEKMMEDDFAALVLEYIKDIASQGLQSETGGGVNIVEERLNSITVGLIHQGKLKLASSLREIILPWIKSNVREVNVWVF